MKVVCEVVKDTKDYSAINDFLSAVISSAESTCRIRKICNSKEYIVANRSNTVGVNPFTNNVVFGKLLVEDDCMKIAIFVATAKSANGFGKYANFKKVGLFSLSDTENVRAMIKDYALVDIDVDAFTCNLIFDAFRA